MMRDICAVCGAAIHYQEGKVGGEWLHSYVVTIHLAKPERLRAAL